MGSYMVSYVLAIMLQDGRKKKSFYVLGLQQKAI